MKKFLAVLTLLSAVSFAVPNTVAASWWYDVIHSDRGSDSEWVDCWSCNGSGDCPTCGGTGEGDDDSEDCSDCGGSGRCNSCGGLGGEWE